MAFAQVAPAAAQATSPAAPAPSPATADDAQSRLRDLERRLAGSEQNERAFQTELEANKADRARLTAALLEMSARTRELEAQALATQRRLDTAQASEDAIQRSLATRKQLIARVLEVLQRMSRKPPPAVLMEPHDILAAIRTSMLLGAVIPQMRTEIETLTSDLLDLAHAREAVSAEHAKMNADLAALGKQRAELDADIAERQRQEDRTQSALSAEASRGQDLARQASSLRDLLDRMQREGSGAAAGDALAKAASIPFSKRRGRLAYPVAGRLVKEFGDSDGFGSSESGDSFETLPSAVVTAPADSWVAFSGPYRTYGQLLILNAGEGYYLVMAGMARMNVEVGQFVVAGEPIALMGDGSTKTAATIAVGAVRPVLYVEFRKDGSTIDPGPWWAKSESEKARG